MVLREMSHFPSSTLRSWKSSQRSSSYYPSHPRTPSASFLRCVNLSFGPAAISAIHSSNPSGAVSPRDDSGESPLSLLDVHYQETRARLKRGLALTMSTQAIKQSIALRYMKEINPQLLQPQPQIKPKGRKLRVQHKALSLDFSTPLSPKSPKASLFAAGTRLPILPKQSSRLLTSSTRLRLKSHFKP
jgi:hypothetical protein